MADSRTSTPILHPTVAPNSSRPPSPFSRPLAPPVQIIRSLGHSSSNTSSGANTPNAENLATATGVATLNRTPPGSNFLPNPLLSRTHTPPGAGPHPPAAATGGGGGGGGASATSSSTAAANNNNLLSTPVPSAAGGGHQVATVPLTGKALDHWLSLQGTGANVNNSRTNSPSPSPRNPNLPLSSQRGGAEKKNLNAAHMDPSAKNDAMVNDETESHPAFNAQFLLQQSSMSPQNRRRAALRIHDGIPLKTLAELEAEEKEARAALIRGAAATNFVELALGIACLQRTEAVLKNKIGDEEYEEYLKRVRAIQQQYFEHHHHHHHHQAGAGAVVAETTTMTTTVAGLTKRTMLAIHTLNEELVKKPPEIPTRTYATQVDFLTAPRLRSELFSSEERARLRVQLQAAEDRAAMESDFFAFVNRSALDELEETSEMLEKALADLDEESKKRMQLELDQLVTEKKSNHAKQVADEMTQELAREKESVDSERQARMGIEKALDEANAEVDAHTVSATHLQTQAARAKVAVAATKFATTDHGTQVGGGIGIGGGVRSVKDCPELVLNPKLVPHASELTSFHADVKCTLRGENFNHSTVHIDLVAAGGATLNIFRGSNTASSSSLSLDEPPLLSCKVASIAAIQRLFERENVVRLVIGQTTTASSPNELTSSASASLRPSASTALGPTSLTSIVGEHAAQVDLVACSRRDLERLMEALAIARSTFSSRCYVQRIWGSSILPSLAPTKLEADYRVRIQTSSSFEDSFMLASSATLKQGAVKAAAAAALSTSGVFSSSLNNTTNNNNNASSSSSSVFVSLQRMAQCRIAFVAADDIFLGTVSEVTLSEIAASAQLLVLWKFTAAASSSSKTAGAFATVGGGGGGALSGAIPFGKQSWKNWAVVISDSCSMPSYIEAGGGTTHLLVAATKEAQTWLTAYETTKRQFCAQMSLTVTLLGSRLSFSTCQVPMAVAARMKKKQMAAERSGGGGGGGGGAGGGDDELLPSKSLVFDNTLRDFGEEEASEQSEPSTLALVHDEAFCSNADAVFLLTGSSSAHTTTECLDMGLNNTSGSIKRGTRSRGGTNKKKSDVFGGGGGGSAPFLQDGPAPVSWMKIPQATSSSRRIQQHLEEEGDEGDVVAASSTRMMETSSLKESYSALSVFLCSNSFLPSAVGDTLWRPPSSSAVLLAATGVNPVQQLAQTGSLDQKPHCVVVPIRRVACTILGQPSVAAAAAAAGNNHDDRSGGGGGGSPSSRRRASAAATPQQLVIKSLAVRLLPGVGEDVISREEQQTAAATATMSCQLVSPCIEPATLRCSCSSSAPMQQPKSVEGRNEKEEEEEEEGDDDDDDSKASANVPLLFTASDSSVEQQRQQEGIIAGNLLSFPVETITADRTRLASDIMTLKLLNKSVSSIESSTAGKKTSSLFGNFSLLNAVGHVPGDGESVRCVFRLFEVKDGASRLAGEAKLLLSMPARL